MIDYKKYPPNWKQIRARILQREKNCCAWCGVPNGAMLDHGRYKCVLTIAHLDHDEENWEVKDERLAALCQACHLKYDRWRHVMKRKYGTDFFKTQPHIFK